MGCIIRAWEAWGRRPSAFLILMMHWVGKCVIFAWAWVLVYILWPVWNIKADMQKSCVSTHPFSAWIVSWSRNKHPPAVLTTCRMEGNTWWQICPTLPILSLKPSSKPKILSNMRKALLSAQHWPDGGIQIPRIPLLQYYKGILFNPIQFNSKVFIWQWLVLREYNKLKKLQPLMLLDANAVWDLITWKRTDLRIRKGRKKKIRTNGWLVIPLMLAPQQSRHAVQRQ